jgi:ABC-type polar amino acid transport system ATPase subunit
MLNVTRLSKSFKGHIVLDQISFTLPLGSIVVLLGPSGSGKSTLLRCLSRLETPEEGTISFQDQPLASLSPQAIGLVFQNFQLFPHLTVLQNITLAPVMLQGKGAKKTLEQKALSLLQSFCIAEKATAYPAHLSGGQKQRVAICRTLMMDPLLLLFDEPTSALDPEMVTDVAALIHKLKKPDRLIVVATHELRLAQLIADFVCFFDLGQLVELQTARDFFKAPTSPRAQKFIG